MPRRNLSIAALLLVTLSAFSQPRPKTTGLATGAFATPLTAALIDDRASAEWVHGAEHPLPNPATLRQLLWTQTSAPGSGYIFYGADPQPGPRHLRLGFSSPVPVGSILTRAGDQVSVLRPDSPYPGNLADDSQWIAAQRNVPVDPNQRSAPSQEAGRLNFALWILPPGTKTRAIRFTHIAQAEDKTFTGTLGGLYLLSSRYTNLAPQAVVTTSTNPAAAHLLNDEKDNWGHPWDNGPDFRHPVTPAAPEWITLTWPQPVALGGLGLLWAGFSTGDIQTFTGPASTGPQSAPDSNWKNIAQPLQLYSQYPRPLAVDWIDFKATTQTRAIRLRLTGVTDETSINLKGLTKEGNRVWLGDLLALSPLGNTEFKTASVPAPSNSNPKSAPAAAKSDPNAAHPPIPIHFTLTSSGFVTLVIEDPLGNRIRNLISDTWFESGPNTVWWDGTDDLGRNNDAASHGVYLIPTHFLSPGHYTVRGLVHKQIELRYEFSPYNAGHPAWETADTKGAWLATHTPPSAALFVPAEKAPGGKPLVYLGSYVTEGGSGLAWVDLNGIKQGGRTWIGGNWTGAPYLARDLGEKSNPEIYAYVGAAYHENASKTDKTQIGVLRLNGLTARGDKPILNYHYAVNDKLTHSIYGGNVWTTQMAGLAVRNGLIVASLFLQNQLVFADVTTGKFLGTASLDSPRGLAFDPQGHLLVLTRTQLQRYTITENPSQLTTPTVLISVGLEDPAGLTLDSAGNILISDRGNSNQIKTFSPAGKLLRTIGHPGPAKSGSYDPLHMNNPRGLTIDGNNHLWVAEEDFQPKRVSVWTLDGPNAGSLVKAFYGPSEYGGGGALDPTDKSLFYYRGMQFKLDWKTGTDTLQSVLYRHPDQTGDPKFPLPLQGTPTTVIYSNGHRFFTNAYLGRPTNGAEIAMVYLDNGDQTIRPVAAFGRAVDWLQLATPPIKPLWPPNPHADGSADNQAIFTWSDLNGDGKVDPEEVTFLRAKDGSVGWITVMPDLSMIDAYLDGNVLRFTPKFLSNGTPTYDIKGGRTILTGAQLPHGDGGGQIIYSPQAIVTTTAPKPFAQEGVGGLYTSFGNATPDKTNSDQKEHRWSYPSLWPGLHPAHAAPVATQPGELLGATRLLGGFVTPPNTDAGPLWSINGNFGDLYLFTADGLYIDQLFQDLRTGKPWSAPIAQRNMLVNDLTLASENFFPTINQTPDGQIYLVDGVHTAIVRVDGLNTIQRIPTQPLDLTASDLQKAQHFLKQSELTRQQTYGPKSLKVILHSGSAPSLSNLADTLSTADWATIDSRITQIGWGQFANDAQAAITIAGGRLYAAYRTNDPKVLVNTGTVPNAPFKTGGALDLMLGTNPAADPNRTTPVAGDLRLLVYQVQGQTKATLYKAVVSGTTDPISFTSPDRTITLDQVRDVTSDLQFEASTTTPGLFTFSIPLSTLGLKPTQGEKIKADLGLLRGANGKTIQRIYWSNKATGITDDVPSEAELTPDLWGEWTFTQAP